MFDTSVAVTVQAFAYAGLHVVVRTWQDLSMYVWAVFRVSGRARTTPFRPSVCVRGVVVRASEPCMCMYRRPFTWLVPPAPLPLGACVCLNMGYGLWGIVVRA